MTNDIKYEVNAGFFNAINEDRTYSADDMNRPYKRLISNGVFASPKGTASNDLQVFSEVDSMNVTVSKGDALIGDKWFENPSNLIITISQNTEILSRIDSIIAQVDINTSGRMGNIVYRKGKASSNPVHPEINTEENIKEFRLADILINPSCSKITQDLITDFRGSSECPWVTSLIYQVDTSTLYVQWQEAYRKKYEEQEMAFNSWFDKLKTTLSGDVAGNLKLEIDELGENLRNEIDVEKEKTEELNNTVSNIKNDVGEMNFLKIHVMERGTNSNGSYIRYSDGTMKCWKIKKVKAGGSKWENLYYSDHNMGKWAKEFKTLISSKATIFSKQFWCTQEKQTCDNAGTVRCFRPNANTASITILIEAWGYYIEDHNNLQNIDRVYTLEGSSGSGPTYG